MHDYAALWMELRGTTAELLSTRDEVLQYADGGSLGEGAGDQMGIFTKEVPGRSWGSNGPSSNAVRPVIDQDLVLQPWIPRCYECGRD